MSRNEQRKEELLARISRSLLALMLIWSPLLLGSNRLIFWLLNGLVAAVTLGFFLASEWRSRSMTNGSWTLPAILFVLLALPAIWMGVQLLPGFPEGIRHPVWAGVPAVPGRITIDARQTQIALVWWLTLAVVFVALRIGMSPRKTFILMNIMLLTTVAVALFGFANGHFGWNSVGLMPKTAYQGWLTGTFVNRNTAASIFSIGIMVAAALTLQTYSNAHGDLRQHSVFAWILGVIGSPAALYAGAGCVLLIALLLTGSRAGIASCMAGAVAAAFLSPVPKRYGWRFMLGGFIAAALMSVIAFRALADRILQAPDSSIVRLSLFKEAIAAIFDRPLLGHGGGTYQSVEPLYHRADTPSALIWNHAHSTYLEAAVGMGLPVTLAWLALAGWLLLRMWNVGRLLPGIMPATFAATSVIVTEGIHAVVDFSLQVQAIALYAACLVGLAIGEIMAAERNAALREKTAASKAAI